MIGWLWAVAFADETGATVDCMRDDQACVTTGGLPGLCTAGLECATEVCYEDGEECALDGVRGTCDGEECVVGNGCATVPAGHGLAAVVTGLTLVLTRRRDGRAPPARPTARRR